MSRLNRRSAGRGVDKIIASVMTRDETKEMNSDMVGELVQTELPVDVITKRIDSWTRSPEFTRLIDEMIRDHAKAILIDILAERDEELEATVRKTLTERFDAEVSRVAHQLLTDKLAELKRRLAGT